MDIKCLSFPVSETLHLVKTQQTLEWWNFPCLTTLHLKESRLNEYDKPFSFEGFDCLKELILAGCEDFCSREVLIIKSSNLAHLTISQGKDWYYGLCEFVISTPKLSSFAFSGKCIPVLSVECGFPCLEEVDFSFGSGRENLNQELMQRLNCLFNEFRGTKCLTLSWKTIQMLMEYSKRWSSPFTNLKTLYVLNSDEDNSHVINYLLNSSPDVKVFIQEYDDQITYYNPEEDTLLYENSEYRVIKSKKQSASSDQVDADVLHRVLGVIPQSMFRNINKRSYRYRHYMEFSVWEGHQVYSEDVILLKYIKEKHPETFEHFAPQTNLMYTLGLITLCSLVRALSEVSSATASTISHCRDLFTDLKRWGFNTTWLDILNNVDETSLTPFSLINDGDKK